MDGYRQIDYRIDGTSFLFTTFGDYEGLKLESQWIAYITERIVEDMTNATLIQIKRNI